MTLLQRVSAVLTRAGVGHALIGASALAVHGVLRATVDQDLLCTERAPLAASFWNALEGEGVEVTVRRGDALDPLAGVVVCKAAGERPIDVVVGKHAWQKRAIERAEPGDPGSPPVVRLVDLILLKLFAGGPQDAWDVQQLLATDAGSGAVAEVERELGVLPAESMALWQTLRGSGSTESPPFEEA